MKSNNLKFNGFAAHQGDVQIFGITEIPSNAKEVNKTFFAKSEKSGHAHALCGDYSLMNITIERELSGSTVTEHGFIVEIGEGGATLNHTKYSNLTAEYWDENVALNIADHKPTTLSQGIYYIGIQKRKQHFQKAWEQVKD